MCECNRGLEGPGWRREEVEELMRCLIEGPVSSERRGPAKLTRANMGQR